MKLKKMMLVTFLLLAILTIGAVSASDDTNDTLAADDEMELSQSSDVEMVSADDGNDDVLSDEFLEVQQSDELGSAPEDNMGGTPAVVRDISVDVSNTTINATLILADTRTGEVFEENITVGPILSDYLNATTSNVSGNISEAINQLLSIAQIHAGDREVTVISQNVSDAFCIGSFDHRVFQLIDNETGEGRYLLVSGEYANLWQINVTVIAEYKSKAKSTVIDNSTDASTTTINATLILTDTRTGDVYIENITLDPVKSNYTSSNNTDVENNITWAINQLLSIAQSYAGDSQVTTKSENISRMVLGRFDNRTYTWSTDPSNPSIRSCLVEGEYGTLWQINVTVEAEYKSKAKASIVDNSIDSSRTTIVGTLILEDTITGFVFEKNITYDYASSLVNPKYGADEINETLSQLLNIAQIQAGGNAITIKSQNVSNATAMERFDNRTYTWKDGDGSSLPKRYLLIEGEYGTLWQANVTLVAEYEGGYSYMVSFNSTGGEGEMADVKVAADSNYTLPECGFTKIYRIFYGWNVGDAIKQPGENITVHNDTQIRTVWKYNETGSYINDFSVDASFTTFDGILALTDLRSGNLIIKNVTVGPVKSKNTNSDPLYNSTADMISETFSQLLSLAYAESGMNLVIKSQSVNSVMSSQLDNTRNTTYVDVYEGGDDLVDQAVIFAITGTYGTHWSYPILLEAEYESVSSFNLTNQNVTLSKTAFTYNGKVQKPTVKLIGGMALTEGVDYILVYSTNSSKKVGTYTISVIGTGLFTGTAKATYKINKAANPLKVKAKTAKVKFSKLIKKAQTLKVTQVIKFTKKGQGTMTYAKMSGNKKITINKKTGKVTVKKGLKKGTYKVKVKIRAKGNTNYKASAYKKITFKIKVC